MASLLFLPHPTSNFPRAAPRPNARTRTRARVSTITCGPRDNRGPLQRGRSLSTEAIHAVQSLKRLTAADRSPEAAQVAASASLGRLLRLDLLAAMAELQRQGHWSLALAALHVARAESWYRPDPEIYATFVSSSPPSEAAGAAVDALVEAFLDEKERGRGRGFSESEGVWVGQDVYKLTRLVRALIAKGRGRAAWRVYDAAVRRGGCEVDENMYRVMARGLKRLGLEAEAAEVEADFAEWDARASPPARRVLDEMRSTEKSKAATTASSLVMARGLKRLGLEADIAEWDARVSPPARHVLDEMRSR